jgi:hypothetical protein
MRRSLGFSVCWRVAAASGRLEFELKAVKRGSSAGVSTAGHGALRQRGEARSLEGVRRSGFADVASIGALVPIRLSEDG